ncbi:MAG TPA: 5-amino-6-(5-phosphoribosylamino)uracil reductase [Aquificaceae bacterium]|nr:5-amino-6-(5-phosphoribosylamino)uracil reductase [Aquificaceae bacterium]HIQ30631.1 5-amino-6-(5-phosphoribosylamino)uracil reductase [Aquifex aeolicus]
MEKRPYVIIVSEVSIDGKLTLYRGASSKELMSLMDEEAYRYLHEIRAKVDGIMVGCETVRTDNPSLTVRYVKGKNPTRVIPCSTANVPLDANVLNTEEAPTVIATTHRAPADRVEKIRERGAEVLLAGDELVDFDLLLPKLYDMGIKTLMVEGGASINWELMKRKAVDEIRLIHLPVVVGGENVPTLVGGEGFKKLRKLPHLRLRSHFRRGAHLITEWEVAK